MVTPERERKMDKAAARLKFHQITVDREVERMTNELKAIGEKVESIEY